MTLSAVLFNCIIFNIIKKYLLHNTMRCLADTCTSLRQYKFENRIMILNDDASNAYYYNEPFRQTILNYRRKMKTKYRQFKFGLKLHHLKLAYSTNKTLHDIFEGVYYVDLSYAKELTDITALKNIPIVKASSCTDLTKIDILSHNKDLSEQMVNTNYLDLNWYDSLNWYDNTEDCININSFISLEYCTAITDFSSLKGIMHVDLSGCEQITNADLVHFSDTKTLNLSGCHLISDVSMLSHLNGLDISKCPYIEDVSSLSKLHTLKLHCCRITDVSALGKLNNLDLSCCYNLTDVSALGNVIKLNLSCCYNLTDVSALGNVKNLNLSSCDSLIVVSALGNVIDLYLNSCNNITDVSALGKVIKLDLSSCDNITDVSALINVENLNLSACGNITDIPCFNAKILDLSYCKITDFSKLINVKELSLRHCMQITDNDLQFFVNKRFLDLTGCKNITNVDILLDNVQVLDLSFCIGITDLSPFADDGIKRLNRYYIRKLK